MPSEKIERKQALSKRALAFRDLLSLYYRAELSC